MSDNMSKWVKSYDVYSAIIGAMLINFERVSRYRGTEL